MAGQNYRDIVDELAAAAGSPVRPKPRDVPLPQVRGKDIDGVKYLRADDLLAALTASNARANAPLITRVKQFLAR